MDETSGREVTDLLTKAVIGYYVKQMFAVHREFGVLPKGRRRVDVMALKRDRTLIACEVKRDLADFKRDRKWREYAPHCDYLHIALPDIESARGVIALLDGDDDPLSRRVGVMYLNPETGIMRSVRRAYKNPDMGMSRRLGVITKMAWNLGYNKSNSRRQRVFLPKE